MSGMGEETEHLYLRGHCEETLNQNAVELESQGWKRVSCTFDGWSGFSIHMILEPKREYLSPDEITWVEHVEEESDTSCTLGVDNTPATMSSFTSK